MKIAITGHTQGLGKACYDLFLSLNYQVCGLSRRNGFNIVDVNDIVNKVGDCDIFINNAYEGIYQSVLLEKLFAAWQYSNKSIITIGSMITSYPRIEKNLDDQPWAYRDNKKDLERKFRELSNIPHTCRLQLITPGPMNTAMIKHHHCKKMQPDDVANIINQIMFNQLIKEITLYE